MRGERLEQSNRWSIRPVPILERDHDRLPARSGLDRTDRELLAEFAPKLSSTAAARAVPGTSRPSIGASSGARSAASGRSLLKATGISPSEAKMDRSTVCNLRTASRRRTQRTSEATSQPRRPRAPPRHAQAATSRCPPHLGSRREGHRLVEVRSRVRLEPVPRTPTSGPSAAMRFWATTVGADRRGGVRERDPLSLDADDLPIGEREVRAGAVAVSYRRGPHTPPPAASAWLRGSPCPR